MTQTQSWQIEYPAEAGETGVTDTQYPVGDVRRYGAVGDSDGTVGNGTDDQATLQNAFTSAAVLGYEMIFEPNKIYRISLGIGTDVTDRDDFVDRLSIDGRGATLFLDAPATSTCALLVEGNVVSVKNLSIDDGRTVDHTTSLTPQRTPYHYGMSIGGKGYLDSPRSLGDIADFKSGVRVENVKITNFNLPLSVFRSSDVDVSNCTIDQFTDTGLLVDDCTTDIRIHHNHITRGGDDLIFCRHTNNSPYITPTERYIGGLQIHDNYLEFTYGKCVGTGGFSDVNIHDNYAGWSWAGSINFESDSWVNSSDIYNKNLKATDNVVSYAGRYWGSTGHLKTAPIGNNNDTGIHTVYQTSRGGSTVVPSNVVVSGNLIYNPYANGVAINHCDNVTVTGNKVIAGEYDHGAGAVKSVGAALWSTECSKYVLTDNSVSAEFALAAGDLTFPTPLFHVANGQEGCVIKNNPIDGVSLISIGAVEKGFEMDQVFKTYTTNATPANVIPLLAKAGRILSLKVIATAGTEGGVTKWGHYEKNALYYDNGGSLSIQGTTTLVALENDAALDLNLTSSGYFALPKAVGLAATNINWETRVIASVVS